MNTKSALLILCLLALGYAVDAAYAETVLESNLGRYEEGLYTHRYAGESVEKRLERLETQVFGQTMPGTPAEREQRLAQTLKELLKSPAKDPGTPPSQDTTSLNPAAPSLEQLAPQPVPPAVPDATDYPTVTALEQQVFGRDFIYDEVGNRLSRLEKKVFGQPYPKIALVDRVDKLLMRYPNLQPANDARNSAITGLPNHSEQFVSSSRDVYTKLDLLEMTVFDTTHPSQLITERLDALEKQTYNHAFTGETVDTRLNRLLKAHDSRFAKPSSAAVGPPPIEPRPAVQPAPSASAGGNSLGARQNIQIGSGFSMNSSHQFSPELVNMLPPDVRAQVFNPPPSGQGHVSPPPGFQPYGNAPVEYRNYYAPGTTTTRSQVSGPGFSSSSNSSTTVIGPRTYTETITYPAAPGTVINLPPAGYTGNPAVFQQLAQLEIQVFGQPNVVEPVPVRLSRLETTLAGQMFPGYSDEERLNNLLKVQRYQSLSRILGGGKGGTAVQGAGSLLLGVPLTPVAP